MSQRVLACRLLSEFAAQDGNEVMFYSGEPTLHRWHEAFLGQGRHRALPFRSTSVWIASLLGAISGVNPMLARIKPALELLGQIMLCRCLWGML